MKVWLVAGLQLLIGWMADRHYRSLPEMPAASSEADGHVSIIVPARNEEQALPHLLESLGGLDYPDYDVLVVDDGSTDRTAAVTRQAGVDVLRVEGPPAGWTGKTFACFTGAEATDGRWLLFTDADTVHGPRSLSAGLELARREQAEVVSLLAQQRCRSVWERLLLPYAYALYFAGARRPNQAGGPGIANGQYILILREAYRRIDGHRAVRGSIVEDVRLARVAQSHGIHVVLARGEDHLDVSMYRDLAHLWEGMGKNASRFLREQPSTGVVTALAGMILGSSIVLASRCPWRQRLVLLACPALALAPWYRRFGVHPLLAVLHPLTAAVFQVLALDSLRKQVTGATWKGRRY
ncbi:MAG: glycosyltransferase [Chloroflexota bacterium]